LYYNIIFCEQILPETTVPPLSFIDIWLCSIIMGAVVLLWICGNLYVYL